MTQAKRYSKNRKINLCVLASIRIHKLKNNFGIIRNKHIAIIAN